MNLATFLTTGGAPAADPAPQPAWRRSFLTLAAIGLAWNLFGVLQFVNTLTATPDTLMASGLTAAQASLYLALPRWMTLAFAGGVFGGLIGAAALAWRRRIALPVLAASMLSYVALFAGDAHHGLFDAIPQQLPVLTVVLAVAAALLAGAIAARRTGWLR